MEWVEHHGSGEVWEWNPTAGRATALRNHEGEMYQQIILEKYPGDFYRWDFPLRMFVRIEGVTTMEEAQAVCVALLRLGD